MIHLINLSQRYLGSKGVRLRRLEEPPLGNLAVAGHLEESTSHHSQDYPDLILRTSIFHDFQGPNPKPQMFQGFRSSASNGVDTIGKNAKNYGEPCRVCFVSWISCGVIMGQRGSRKVKWMMGPWAFWRPPATWRRMLRTIVSP